MASASPSPAELRSSSDVEASSTAPIAPPIAPSPSPSPPPTEPAPAHFPPSEPAPPTEPAPHTAPPTTTAAPEREPEKKKALVVTVLMQSGVRHKFKLDAAYLKKHGVQKEGVDVTEAEEMSVAQFKECVWRDWNEEWEPRPASALFIRLIQWGAFMEDKLLLKDTRLAHDSPNVIHMAVRPADIGDDDMTQRSTKGGFGRSGGGSDERSGRSPSCRCVIL